MTQIEKEMLSVIKQLQDILDLYTEAEGFTSVASRRATKLIRALREKESL